MAQLVYGVGLNDSEEPVSFFENGFKTLDRRYNIWTSMLQRSYSPHTKSRQPGYGTSVVCDAWKRRSIFNRWLATQEWEGLALDKNILKEGNNEYRPEYCAFVPSYLNNLFTSRHNFRGDFPLGVTCPRPDIRKPFVARVSVLSERKSLGNYYLASQAHAAWQSAKVGAIEAALRRYGAETFFRPDVAAAVERRIKKLSADRLAGVETVLFQ